MSSLSTNPNQQIDFNQRWEEIQRLGYPIVSQYIQKYDLNNSLLSAAEKIQKVFDRAISMLDIEEKLDPYSIASYHKIDAAHKRLNSIPLPPLPDNYDPSRPDPNFTAQLYDALRFG